MKAEDLFGHVVKTKSGQICFIIPDPESMVAAVHDANGKQVKVLKAPVILSGNNLLPLSEVSEDLGPIAGFKWRSYDGREVS